MHPRVPGKPRQGSASLRYDAEGLWPSREKPFSDAILGQANQWPLAAFLWVWVKASARLLFHMARTAGLFECLRWDRPGTSAPTQRGRTSAVASGTLAVWGGCSCKRDACTTGDQSSRRVIFGVLWRLLRACFSTLEGRRTFLNACNVADPELRPRRSGALPVLWRAGGLRYGAEVSASGTLALRISRRRRRL